MRKFIIKFFRLNFRLTYLTGCSYMSSDTNINWKSWFEWTSSWCFITIDIEIIVSFIIKDTWKASFWRLIQKQNLVQGRNFMMIRKEMKNLIFYLDSLALYETLHMCQYPKNHMFNCTLLFKYHSCKIQ